MIEPWVDLNAGIRHDAKPKLRRARVRRTWCGIDVRALTPRFNIEKPISCLACIGRRATFEHIDA